MDGVLIPILKPSTAEPAFFCRKKYPALNCQVVSNMDHEISSILTLPGSYTDISIWNGSFVKLYMEGLRRNREITESEGKYYIIGKKIFKIPHPCLFTFETYTATKLHSQNF